MTIAVESSSSAAQAGSETWVPSLSDTSQSNEVGAEEVKDSDATVGSFEVSSFSARTNSGVPSSIKSASSGCGDGSKSQLCSVLFDNL